MKSLTAEWLGKAEDDLAAARRLARGSKPLYDQLCFHCQQAAEKYLKALMQELGVIIPRTHDLDNLLILLSPHTARSGLGRGATFLTQFAVVTRYPGEDASRRQAVAALRWAGRFRTFALAALGVPRRRKRKR